MNWNKISIGQGIAIVKAHEIKDPVDREIALLSALHKKPFEYYESLPREQLYTLIQKEDWNYPDPSQNAAFQRGNYYYRFKTLPRQLSKQEFVLVQKYSSVDELHYFMAVLSTKYRFFPKKRMPLDDLNKRAELFYNKMPFGMAYGLMLFFSAYYPNLLRVGQAYFQGAKEAMAKSKIL